MAKSVAIVGAGVSGLTCGVLFAERGFQTAIFAEQIGQQTTSAAAAALWFPYDVEPADKVIPWARASEISIPDWAHPFVMSSGVETSLTVSGSVFSSGFSLNVPLMDTTIYLD